MYDLGIESCKRDEGAPMMLPYIEADNFNVEKSLPSDADGAVKVLRQCLRQIHRTNHRFAGPPPRKPFAGRPNHYENMVCSFKICAYL